MVEWAAILERAQTVLAGSCTSGPLGFDRDWPAPIALRPLPPTTLAVLRWLDEAAETAPAGPLAALAHAVRDAAPGLSWRQTYGPDEVDTAFLERYGWCELFGRSAPIPCDTLACGVLLLGPATHYPSHSHAAEELYVPLSGAAEWQRGADEFVVRPPGECIVHASREAHALRTGAAPLLALYLWRGDGLGESARLRPGTRPSRAD
jgi:mannose-6-phosphate isomerase-like protein (cupin superfamily)